MLGGKKIAWRVETPTETSCKMQAFIGTLKAAAKVAGDEGRDKKEITKDFKKREIYYKGEVLVKQEEWTGEFFWKKTDEMMVKTVEQFEKDEREREKKKKESSS